MTEFAPKVCFAESPVSMLATVTPTDLPHIVRVVGCGRFASVPRVSQDAVKQGGRDDRTWTPKSPRPACIRRMRTRVHKRRATGGQVVEGSNPVSPTQKRSLTSTGAGFRRL